MATKVILGRVGFVDKGQWNGDADYVPMDVVVHNHGVWRCKVANKNITPARNSPYWAAWIDATAPGFPVAPHADDHAPSGDDPITSLNASVITEGILHPARIPNDAITPQWGNVGGKPDSYLPSSHNNSHKPGGSDALPIGAPNMAGLVPAGGQANQFLGVSGGAYVFMNLPDTLPPRPPADAGKVLAVSANPGISSGSPNTVWIDPLIHRIGQYDWFEDEVERPYWVPCLGGWVEQISLYPILAYLLNIAPSRLITAAEYDALHTAIWGTSADGTITYGWNGIGGVNGFVYDAENDRLRVPDLAGMTREQVGYVDPNNASLGVAPAGVRYDILRTITGEAARSAQTGLVLEATNNVLSGAFTTGRLMPSAAAAAEFAMYSLKLDTGLLGPNYSGSRTQVQSWLSSCRVYLGRPAS